MSVKRYSLNLSANRNVELNESLHGSLVKYHDYAELEARCASLAAEKEKFAVECAATKIAIAYLKSGRQEFSLNTPATDAILAEVRAQAHKEGAHFVANRMLAAWEAGFIEDTAKNAADIARMILTSTEFMDNAPEGDFNRSFSDGVLEDIADQLRKGGKQ